MEMEVKAVKNILFHSVKINTNNIIFSSFSSQK